jgi:hypothetical protein
MKRFIVLACLSIAAAPAIAQTLTAPLRDARVAYSAELPDRFTFNAGGVPFVLSIEAHTRIEREVAPYARAVADGRHRYFRGRIDSQAGSWARLAHIDGAWIGAVWDGGTLWLLDSAAQHAQAARDGGIPADATVVFSTANVHLPEGYDLAGEHPSIASVVDADATHAIQRSTQGITRFLKVTLVLDTEFQALHGGNSASVAGAVLNIVDGFYSNQVGVDVSLFHLRSLASNGAMTPTNANALLDALRAYVNGGNVPVGGVVHLLSGKNFDGDTVGLAYVGAVCAPQGFNTGINQITFSNAFGGATLAHEIGHNFEADHDSDGNACPASGFIMAAIINTGNPANQFSTCSLAYFNNYLQKPLTCLNGAPDLIFANGFQQP